MVARSAATRRFSSLPDLIHPSPMSADITAQAPTIAKMDKRWAGNGPTHTACAVSDQRARRWQRRLIPHIFLDVALLLRGGVDRAVGIDGDAFRRLQFRIGHERRRDVGRNLPVFHAANANARLAVAIVVRTLRIVRGLGVDRIKHVVLIDPQSAWAAE